MLLDGFLAFYFSLEGKFSEGEKRRKKIFRRGVENFEKFDKKMLKNLNKIHAKENTKKVVKKILVKKIEKNSC